VLKYWPNEHGEHGVNFLKGFGTFLLGLLLFLSLSVFSVAFVLNSTVLNPGFITRQVDRLDISAVARDIAEKEIGDEIPAELDFLKEAVYNVIDDKEPWVKEQASQAIDTGYDFFLGKTDRLQILIPLDDFKKDLKDSLWRELNKQLTIWLRDNTDSELMPYIERNLPAYRQVLPSELSLLSDAQLKSYLETFLHQVRDQIVATGQAPALTGLLETLVRPYFDEYYDEFTAQIPAELTTADIPANVMDQLRLARKYIGYFRSGFYWLIVFMVVLAAGIFLIHRNIQDPSRALGTDLALYGALDLAGTLVARSFFPSALEMDIPASLHQWLTGIFNDVTGIMLGFSIGVLVIGAALIVVSFVFKKPAAEG
jgi:hypothetical protein